jgi:hypothetical protein
MGTTSTRAPILCLAANSSISLMVPLPPMTLPHTVFRPTRRGVAGKVTGPGGTPTMQSLPFGLSIFRYLAQSMSALTLDMTKSREFPALFRTVGSPVAHGGDGPHDFVPRHEGIGTETPVVVAQVDVTVADTTVPDRHLHLPGAQRRGIITTWFQRLSRRHDGVAGDAHTLPPFCSP